MFMLVTSSSSSKTEFTRIFYDVFDVGGYASSSQMEVSLLYLLAYLPCIIFLGSCLVLLVRFGAYGHLHDKLEFIENGVHMPLLLRFRCCSFYRSYSRKGSHHFLMAFSNLLLIVISIKIVLALVASFPTNLVSSNSESVCRSCDSFGVLKRLQRYYRGQERM